jgi:hypothetical protein
MHSLYFSREINQITKWFLNDILSVLLNIAKVKLI